MPLMRFNSVDLPVPLRPVTATNSPRWIDEGLHFAVIDRSDAEAFGRDDPGSQFPERTMERAKAGDGADVELVGERSTQWYSGAGTDPLVLVPGRASAGGAVGEVLQGVAAGSEAGFDEIVTLFGARGPEVAAVAEVADDLRRSIVGDDVTWIANRNINYTNVCTFKCRFCGFSKGPLSLNLRGTPYLLEISEIVRRSAEAWSLGATEVCLQGGIHPDFDGDYYIDVARAVHAEVPGIHIHGFTALEVTEGARRNGEPLGDYLRRLRAAGQRSLPGTAAEILDDEVRETLCPDKITTDEWLECHRIAHGIGLRLQRDHHVRVDRAARALGPPHAAHPGAASLHRRVHRVRRAAVRAHGVADIPAAQSEAGPHVP